MGRNPIAFRYSVEDIPYMVASIGASDRWTVTMVL